MTVSKISPHEGGCWFCNTKDQRPMVFDEEFDTLVHIECIKKSLTAGSPEAEIMSYLLKDDNEPGGKDETTV